MNNSENFLVALDEFYLGTHLGTQQIYDSLFEVKIIRMWVKSK